MVEPSSTEYVVRAAACGHRAFKCLVALLLAFQAVQARPNVNTTTERQDGKLNVHVIALLAPSDAQASIHSFTSSEEDDSSSIIRKFDSEYMFETVLTSLLDSTDRTLACSDVGSFVRWWQHLHPETQAVVRELVRSGRWEFVNGGLVESDEAASYYVEMLDQMTLGMRFLRNELGVTPKVAWGSKGSGYSATEATLKAMGGFQGIFHDMSSDKQALHALHAKRAAEYVWRSSQAFGPSSNIFVAQYDTSWWCMNNTDATGKTAEGCMADIYKQFRVPNAPLPGGKQRPNLQQLVDNFVAKAQLLSSYTPGNDVPFIAQHNFSTASGTAWYAALDILMHSVNADGRVNVLYSTPSLYLHAKLSNRTAKYLVREDDSMPYPTKTAGHWGGVYGSTAIMKVGTGRGMPVFDGT
jgi:alpha-mannosidase